MELKEQQDLLLKALLEAEREAAGRIVVNWAESHTYLGALTDLFQPVLDMFGNLWIKGEISLAQGYVAGLVAEDVFLKASLSDEFPKSSDENARIAVIGNAEDDYHALGRKLLVVFLKLAGWQVHDLGNDVVAGDFVQKAVETNACIIGVSAMMYTTALNIRKIREELDKKNLSGKIQLAVGGAVFRIRPELCEEVGGDGTTDNALQANELFYFLMERSANCRKESDE